VQFDGGREEPFQALRPDALPEVHELAGIEGLVLAEIFLAGEILPIGVFPPSHDHALVALVEHTLGHQHAQDAACRYGRAAGMAEKGCRFPLDKAPIDLPCQNGQGVPHIDQLVKAYIKERKLIRAFLFSQHILQGFYRNLAISLQFPTA